MNALATKTNWTLPNRRLISKGITASLNDQGGIAGISGNTLTVRQVQNTLRAIEAKQAPRDRIRTLDQFRMGFMDGHASGFWMIKGGTSNEELLITRTAMYDLARQVLPGHGLAFIRKLAQTSSPDGLDLGEQLATAAWNHLALAYGNKQVLVRECNMNINGETRRVIRAVRSTKYGIFSNLDTCDVLVEQGYADNRVLNWTLEDNRMRLRIALDDTPWEQGKILPVNEISNSETGHGQARQRGSGLRVDCTNGLTSIVKNHGVFGTNHVGDSERVRDFFVDATENIHIAATGQIESYHKSLGVAVDDLNALVMRHMMEANYSEAKAKKAVALLADPTTTVESVLGAAVDAITLCAQSEADLVLQEEMEASASQLLAWGLNQGGSIHVHN